MGRHRHVPDSSNFFSRVIEKLGNLSKEDLRSLACLARSGDIEARNKIASHNLKLVFKFFGENPRFYGEGALEWADLFQEALRGLLLAAEKFDPDKGPFSPYAWRRIREVLLEFIRDNAKTIRIPSNRVTRRRKIEQVSSQLYFNFDREPTIDEIARALGLSVDKVKEALYFPDKRIISLNQTSGDENKRTLEETLRPDAIKRNEMPLDFIEMEENLQKLFSKLHWFEQLLDELRVTDRAKSVFRFKHGITDGSYVRKSSIGTGKLLNPPVSAQNVSEIVAKVWEHLEKHGVGRTWGENFLSFFGSEDLEEVLERYEVRSGKKFELV